jgi:hypothetical protein
MAATPRIRRKEDENGRLAKQSSMNLWKRSRDIKWETAREEVEGKCVWTDIRDAFQMAGDGPRGSCEKFHKMISDAKGGWEAANANADDAMHDCCEEEKAASN